MGEPEGDPRHDLVPTLGTGLFEAQLRHLRATYAVVPASGLLAATLERRREEPVPVAITFDDDLQSHVDIAAPALVRAELPATFFLCGADSFWWDDLQLLVDRGPEAPSRLRSAPELDLAPALRRVPYAIHQLAEAIERLPPERRDVVAAELHSRTGAADGRGKENIRKLSAAGFELGFHTRRHYLLSTLDDSRLQEAMTEGRQLLEAEADAAMTMIAYPHGKADSRIAAAARAAGYQFGFTASPEAVRPTTDPLLIGRVEALGGSLAQFERTLAATLDRVD